VICETWEVVPFPCTDSPPSKHRPALVLSRLEFNRAAGHSLLAQITKAKKSAWPGDVRLDHQQAGPPEQSMVRMKLFTIDNRLILRRAGRLALRRPGIGGPHLRKAHAARCPRMNHPAKYSPKKRPRSHEFPENRTPASIQGIPGLQTEIGCRRMRGSLGPPVGWHNRASSRRALKVRP
jgi:mRNA-degrading endonuclease toxin of MazEF toxin-antitoxin module